MPCGDAGAPCKSRAVQLCSPFHHGKLRNSLATRPQHHPATRTDHDLSRRPDGDGDGQSLLVRGAGLSSGAQNPVRRKDKHSMILVSDR